MEAAMRACVEECNATLLHIHLHHFTPNGGISGVAVLAESHISVHTWPEKDYAAFDVFMCGDSNPHRAVEILGRYFRPSRSEVVEGEHDQRDRPDEDQRQWNNRADIAALWLCTGCVIHDGKNSD